MESNPNRSQLTTSWYIVSEIIGECVTKVVNSHFGDVPTQRSKSNSLLSSKSSNQGYVPSIYYHDERDSVANYPCPNCPELFNSVLELLHHMVSHYGNQIREKLMTVSENQSKCPICKEILPTDACIQHYGINHGLMSQKLLEETRNRENRDSQAEIKPSALTRLSTVLQKLKVPETFEGGEEHSFFAVSCPTMTDDDEKVVKRGPDRPRKDENNGDSVDSRGDSSNEDRTVRTISATSDSDSNSSGTRREASKSGIAKLRQSYFVDLNKDDRKVLDSLKEKKEENDSDDDIVILDEVVKMEKCRFCREEMPAKELERHYVKTHCYHNLEEEAKKTYNQTSKIFVCPECNRCTDILHRMTLHLGYIHKHHKNYLKKMKNLVVTVDAKAVIKHIRRRSRDLRVVLSEKEVDEWYRKQSDVEIPFDDYDSDVEERLLTDDGGSDDKIISKTDEPSPKSFIDLNEDSDGIMILTESLPGTLESKKSYDQVIKKEVSKDLPCKNRNEMCETDSTSVERQKMKCTISPTTNEAKSSETEKKTPTVPVKSPDPVQREIINNPTTDISEKNVSGKRVNKPPLENHGIVECQAKNSSEINGTEKKPGENKGREKDGKLDTPGKTNTAVSWFEGHKGKKDFVSRESERLMEIEDVKDENGVSSQSNLPSTVKTVAIPPEIMHHGANIVANYTEVLSDQSGAVSTPPSQIFPRHTRLFSPEKPSSSDEMSSDDGPHFDHSYSGEPDESRSGMKCKLCQTFLLSQGRLPMHLLRAHFYNKLCDVLKVRPNGSKDMASNVKCPSCPVKFRNRNRLLQHFGINHKIVLKMYHRTIQQQEEKRKAKKEKEEKENWCNQYIQPFKFKTQMDGEFFEKYRCTKCGLMFEDELSTRGHVEETHNVGVPTLEKPSMTPASAPVKTGEFIMCKICTYKYKAEHFLSHIMKQHFMYELLEFLPKSHPYNCPKCGRNFLERQWLLDHYGKEHNMALELYNRTGAPSAQEKPQAVPTPTQQVLAIHNQLQRPPALPQQIVVPGIPSTTQIIRQPPVTGEKPIETKMIITTPASSVVMDEKVFVCRLCPEQEDQTFNNNSSLRCHLVDKHLSKEIEEEMARALNESLLCPDPTCRKKLSSRSDLITHFLWTHGQKHGIIYGADFTKETEAFKLFQSQQCPECLFRGIDLKTMALHNAKVHEKLLDVIVERRGIKGTLLPILRSTTLTQKELAIKKALSYHSRNKNPVVSSKHVDNGVYFVKSLNQAPALPPSTYGRKPETHSDQQPLPIQPSLSSSLLPPTQNVQVVPTQVQGASTQNVQVVPTQIQGANIQNVQVVPTLPVLGAPQSSGHHKNIAAQVKLTQQKEIVFVQRPQPSTNITIVSANLMSDEEVRNVLKRQSESAASEMKRHPPIKPGPLSTKRRKIDFSEEGQKPRQEVNLSPVKKKPIPTKGQMMKLIKNLELNPKCDICNYKEEKGGLRHIMIHVYKNHFHDEIKRDALRLMQSFYQVVSLEPISNYQMLCPGCQMDCNTLSGLCDHLAINHKKVLKKYWGWLEDNQGPSSPIVSWQSDNEIPELIDGSKLSTEDESPDKRSPSPMLLLGEAQDFEAAKRNLEVRKEKRKIFVQNYPCYIVDPNLPHCNMCDKVRRNEESVVGHCCQFEGFRKIVYRHDRFVPVGYLHPHNDPKPTDRRLWEPNVDEYTLPTIDPEAAEFILLHVGDQFCNMVAEETRVLTEYLQNSPRNVIWKRMQTKVREMCDVCSTSIFNMHWTCGECGVLVCLDCFVSRKKATSNSPLSSPEGSRQNRPHKRFGKNRDVHLWPLCKDKAVHHNEQLLLTQIICGDILTEMGKLVHELRDELGIRKNCDCCKEVQEVHQDPQEARPAVQLVRDEEEINVVDSCPGSVCSDDKEELREGTLLPPKDLATYTKCPLCKTEFEKDRVELRAVHITRHFITEISDMASTENPTQCPKCPETITDKFQMVLHIGIEHGETLSLLETARRKRLSMKNVVLKVDSEKKCRVCGMDFTFHMMGKPQIRIHVFTHFREDIHQEVADAQQCPECGISPPATHGKGVKSWLVNHRGILHKRLDDHYDKYVGEVVEEKKIEKSEEKQEEPTEEKVHVIRDLARPKVRTEKPVIKENLVFQENNEAIACSDKMTSKSCVKKINVSEYKEKYGKERLPSVPDPKSPATIMESRSAIESSSRGTQKPFTDFCCEICDTWLSRSDVAEHRIFEHYKLELEEAILEFPRFDECNKCPFRTKHLDDMVRHVALAHGMIDSLLKDSELMQSKRENYIFGEGLEVQTKKIKEELPDYASQPVCALCKRTVTTNLTRHLALHFWLNINSGRLKCPKCEEQHVTKYEDIEILYAHLSEDHIFGAGSDEETFYIEGREFSLKADQSGEMIENIRNVLQSRWCVLCESGIVGTSESNHLAEHLHQTEYDGLEKDDPFECSLCDGFPVFKDFDTLWAHHAKEHMQAKVRAVIASIDSINSVEMVRQKLKVTPPPPPPRAKPRRKSRSRSTSRPTTPTLRPSSRSSTPGFYADMAKGKMKTELIKVEEERDRCAFCDDGYLTRDYYHHMAAQHFREVFVREVPAEPPFQCPRCIFIGDNIDELIVHFADYHRVLDYLMQLLRHAPAPKADSVAIPKLEDLFESRVFGLEGKLLFACKSCSFSCFSKSKMNLHVFQHFLPTVNLSYTQPFVCPQCFYEAASFLSLVRHYSCQHGFEHQHEPRRRPLVQPNHEEDQDPSATGVHVAIAYKRRRLDGAKAEPTLIKEPFETLLASRLTPTAAAAAASTTDETQPPVPIERPKESIIFQRLDPRWVLIPPQRVISHQESSKLFPDCPHSWLCDGKLLLLHEALNPNNIHLFQDHWRRGQPIIISNSSKHLNHRLWHPKAFLKDFGHLRHSLINCLTGKEVPKAPLKDFWEGFVEVGKRLKDRHGTPMLLKLKDWPPTADIAEYMPLRFNDLFNSFPMSDYTKREGRLNLAAYLPDYFLRPELGPKMYIAYGSALYSDKGSTNLHIDMSDAVNCLVYVGFPKDGDERENAVEVFKEVDKAGCDILMKKRVRESDSLPGALWHIFHPTDTNKIRDFLKKVALEKGKKLDQHDDPIHDQSTYLDGPLRMRLYKEYGVLGYAIVQCAGDTVFVPAGAAHQVRNLHNCIKVAEDFVSPENVSHCLHLTQEFRHLTEFHTNHEDKLQIKSIIYHAIKNAVTVLKRKGTEGEQNQKQ